jgi:hypothetical protein
MNLVRLPQGWGNAGEGETPEIARGDWARAPNSPSPGEDRERPNSLAHRRILHTVIRFADYWTSYPVDMHKR